MKKLLTQREKKQIFAYYKKYGQKKTRLHYAIDGKIRPTSWLYYTIRPFCILEGYKPDYRKKEINGKKFNYHYGIRTRRGGVHEGN